VAVKWRVPQVKRHPIPLLAAKTQTRGSSMSTARISRNDPCPCGSGKKFKHCCHASSFGNGFPQPRPVPTDGAFLRRGPAPPRWPPPPQLKPITRVAVAYSIADGMGKADVTFCYPLGTRIIMADGNVLTVERLKPGAQFRLEDGGVATTTNVEEPKVWEPPSQEHDANGNALRRVIGTVKYTGYYPRMDFGVPGEVIETTPGHLFYSMTRGDWFPLDTFHRGEWLQNDQGQSVPIEWISPMRWEFGDLYNIEVEQFHTYFVGGGPSGSIWTHNGMEMGCRVPRAATEEALETGAINRTGRRAAGVLTEAELNPQHHIFPQGRRQWFADRGVDIDQFTVRLDRTTHDALHAGGGPGRGGGWWNDTIMAELTRRETALGRHLTPAEIQAVGTDFLQQRNLGHLPITPYQR
jgi:hypothetical protein